MLDNFGLEPCRKCNERALPEYYGNLSGQSATRIECLCGNSSPMCDTEEDATDCWNYTNGPVYAKAIEDIQNKKDANKSV